MMAHYSKVGTLMFRSRRPGSHTILFYLLLFRLLYSPHTFLVPQLDLNQFIRVISTQIEQTNKRIKQTVVLKVKKKIRVITMLN
jgi:hypothetical protein